MKKAALLLLLCSAAAFGQRIFAVSREVGSLAEGQNGITLFNPPGSGKTLTVRFIQVRSTAVTNWDIWMTNQSGTGCDVSPVRNVDLGSNTASVAFVSSLCAVKPEKVDPWRPLYQFPTNSSQSFEVSGDDARILIPAGLGITIRADPATAGSSFFNLRWSE